MSTVLNFSTVVSLGGFWLSIAPGGTLSLGSSCSVTFPSTRLAACSLCCAMFMSTSPTRSGTTDVSPMLTISCTVSPDLTVESGPGMVVITIPFGTVSLPLGTNCTLSPAPSSVPRAASGSVFARLGSLNGGGPLLTLTLICFVCWYIALGGGSCCTTTPSG